jgi:aldose 1-epimerase
MTVSVRAAGTFEGQEVQQFTLSSTTGVEVDILTWGVAVRDWRVPVGETRRSVVLGFDSFEPYPKFSPSFGALAGRVANRISTASFEVDGVTYRTPANWHGHTLHGGPEGLGRINWRGDSDNSANAVRFTHFSPDAHMGFPGNVTFTALYTLTGNRLKLELHATTDRKTPINVVQHQYFNLGTTDTVLDHSFQIAAPAYTESGDMLIPTGAILPVNGTSWDFRAPRTMRDNAGAPIDYDGNLVLATGRDPAEPIAAVTGPDGALTLRLWTDRPGVQLYNSVWSNVQHPAPRFVGKHSGFCLEDQDFPDALHQPHFPSILYEPGRDYRHVCEIEIA